MATDDDSRQTASAGQAEPLDQLAPPLAEALAAIEAFVGRYVVLVRPETIVAVVLWIAHTHAIERADATPYLAISSPEKQSGKTRLLECLGLLARGCSSIFVTPTASTIYRSLDATPEGTLLLDELDAVFRDRSDKYEEVRGVINAGHRRGATVPRNVPGPKNTWVVRLFPVFGPKALAGIGKLPDTITDRAIPVRMLKRKRSEPVEKFRQRLAKAEGTDLAARLAAAIAAQPPSLDADVPAELTDRAADAWEPLLAIADAAGGDWPRRARRAAIVLQANRDGDDSLGLRLLADIRLLFDGRGLERISTAELISGLRTDEEGPWVNERAPLTPHKLSRLLLPFEIASKQLRMGSASLKGYERAGFEDAWERYLPASPSPTEPKHRNTDHERSFDVSVGAPSDGDGTRDLTVEGDYPRSAWDPSDDTEEPEHEPWQRRAEGVSVGGDDQ